MWKNYPQKNRSGGFKFFKQTMNNNVLWKKTLDEIQIEVSGVVFNSFFKNTKLLKIEEGLAHIVCPNNGVLFMLKNKYQSLVLKTIKKYGGAIIKNVFFSSSEQPTNSGSVGPLFLSEEKQNKERLFRAGLPPNLDFENFAVSVSNQMAHAASLAVSNSPGTAYNPLFIWGGVGVGKTHLLCAIGRRVIEKIGLSVLYCSAEDFTNSLVEAIRNKSTGLFRKKYRKTDVLLLDDVQFVSQRDFVQEELFHTFNKLRSEGKQIVFASDKPPKLIKKIEKRLVSRFLSGLVVDIQPPDFELKTAIFLIKARERGIEVGVDIAKIVAGHTEDLRELEGVLLKLKILAQKETKINEETIKKLLMYSDRPTNIKNSPREIIRLVSQEFGIKLKEIKEDGRKKNVVLARHVCMYLLKTLTNLTYENIADLVGKKDHTTVMHGVQKIINQIPNNDSLRRSINKIKSFFS